MSKVNSDHATGLHVHHEIVQMSVSDAQNPVADAHQGMRAGKVGAERQEGLWAGAHLQKGTPRRGDTAAGSLLCYQRQIQPEGYLLQESSRHFTFSFSERCDCFSITGSSKI